MLQQIENDEMQVIFKSICNKSNRLFAVESQEKICKKIPHSSAIKKDNDNWAKGDAKKPETFANHFSDVL